MTKIDTEEGTLRDPDVPIGDSALTGHALLGFKTIMQRCQRSISPLIAGTSPLGIVCNGAVASDKVHPSLRLLESALNSVCLSKYAVAKETIAGAESGKRKALCLPHMQLYLGTNSQKRKVQLGGVRLR